MQWGGTAAPAIWHNVYRHVADSRGSVVVSATSDIVRALGGPRLVPARSPGQLRALSVAGQNVGLAFQIIDDILDVTGTTEQLGKTAGKDRAQQKATYPGIHGIDASRARARYLIAEAEEALAELGERAAAIRALAHFIFERKT